jgi:hypothetical protein
MDDRAKIMSLSIQVAIKCKETMAAIISHRCLLSFMLPVINIPDTPRTNF